MKFRSHVSQLCCKIEDLDVIKSGLSNGVLKSGRFEISLGLCSFEIVRLKGHLCSCKDSSKVCSDVFKRLN